MPGSNMLISLVFQAINRTSGAFGKINSDFKRLDATVTAASKRFEHLSNMSRRLTMTGAGMAAAGAGLSYSLSKPIAAFVELEDAATQLEVTMMDKTGSVGETFGALNHEAISLGNKLPGTTADFYRLSAVMKSLGISERFLVGGGLRAAAYLGVVLRPLGVGYEEAGESAAKFRNAMGITEAEMMPFLDLIQRTSFLGVKLEEMRFAYARAQGSLKPLGLQGLAAAKELAPIFAMLIQAGESGETVGTGWGRLVTTLMDVQKLRKVNAAFGLDLRFTDAGGDFAGITNVIDQLDKLKGLSQADKIAVGKAICGEGEDFKIAMTLMSEGREGYDKMVRDMEKQASLNQRVEKSLSTLGNAWEAFTGTFKNALASVGKAMAPTLKGLSNLLNAVSDRIYVFSERHQTLTKIVGLGAGTLGVALVAFGGLAIGLGVLIKGVSLAAAGLATLKKGVDYLPAGLGILQKGLAAARTAMAAFGVTSWIALLPLIKIIAVAALIAGAVALVYKYWKPIGAFFSGLWAGIREGFAPVLDALAPLAPMLSPVVNAFKSVWGWIKSLLKPVEDTTTGFRRVSEAGRTVGRILSFVFPFRQLAFFAGSLVWLVGVVGDAASWIGRNWRTVLQAFLWTNPITAPIMALNRLVRHVFGINLLQAGKNIITNLWQGMMSVINRPVEAMKGLVQRMRNLLPFSPAKEGPFRDLHRVRIVETIAAGMKPGPLVGAMREALSMTKAVMTPAGAGAGSRWTVAAGGAGGGGPGMGRAGGGQPVVINYSPTVTISGEAAKAKDDFAAMLRQHKDDILRLIEQARLRGMRTAY
jgi:TP901 family phage tail tape measure protein